MLRFSHIMLIIMSSQLGRIILSISTASPQGKWDIIKCLSFAIFLSCMFLKVCWLWRSSGSWVWSCSFCFLLRFLRREDLETLLNLRSSSFSSSKTFSTSSGPWGSGPAWWSRLKTAIIFSYSTSNGLFRIIPCFPKISILKQVPTSVVTNPCCSKLKLWKRSWHYEVGWIGLEESWAMSCSNLPSISFVFNHLEIFRKWFWIEQILREVLILRTVRRMRHGKAVTKTRFASEHIILHWLHGIVRNLFGEVQDSTLRFWSMSTSRTIIIIVLIFHRPSTRVPEHLRIHSTPQVVGMRKDWHSTVDQPITMEVLPNDTGWSMPCVLHLVLCHLPLVPCNGVRKVQAVFELEKVHGVRLSCG